MGGRGGGPDGEWLRYTQTFNTRTVRTVEGCDRFYGKERGISGTRREQKRKKETKLQEIPDYCQNDERGEDLHDKAKRGRRWGDTI